MKQFNKNIYKNDLILVLTLTFLFIVIYLGIIGLGNDKESASLLKIYHKNQLIQTIQLTESQNEIIELSVENFHHKIALMNGQVAMIEADCPDGICVQHKPIKYKGESIICLPHKLVLLVEHQEETEIDAVTW